MLPALPHKRQLSTPQEEAARRRKSLQEATKRRESEAKGSRRRMRRGEAALSPVFLGNAREECPVLERILMNCVAVSNEVGDQDKVFLDTCVRHEICYMCGSGLPHLRPRVRRRSSSSLEAAFFQQPGLPGRRGRDLQHPQRRQQVRPRRHLHPRPLRQAVPRDALREDEGRCLPSDAPTNVDTAYENTSRDR
ncbi:uncharacterized protein LOC119594343 [Penaeus monodon]|uniref:uncharacterized protein LOC119594343 n=1 Tax=Penaeus monodon TaxID=6687 RepID=UPI0018A72A7C|nr:uncharacterized protein LOC119594343 [Penaeus monodon]